MQVTFYTIDLCHKINRMQIENNKAQMRKGVLELCILLILSRREAYPSDIIEDLKKIGLELPEGTVYPLLTRLKNDGLLAYRWEESTKGPPRKYYKATEEGAAFALELDKAWQELTQSIERLREPESTNQNETNEL